MLKVSITADIEPANRYLREVAAKQMPFAISLALNNTAKHVKEMEDREIRDVFDRPNPYTQRSVYIKYARKDELFAEVGLKDRFQAAKGTSPAKYLSPQVLGGGRSLKRFEVALRAAGVLPSGMFVVPGEAAKLDVYGNIQRGQIVQILSYFKAFPEAGYKANISTKKKASLRRGSKKRQGFEYFVGRPGGRKLPLGVWQRVYFAGGTAVKPVLIFVTRAYYEATFDFEYVARKAAERKFAEEYNSALARAIATARY